MVTVSVRARSLSIELVARYNPGRDNKSLDASGASGLVIDNLFVTWLTAAASTQPFGAYLNEFDCFVTRACCV
jgi:hypothetical protein